MGKRIWKRLGIAAKRAIALARAKSAVHGKPQQNGADARKDGDGKPEQRLAQHGVTGKSPAVEGSNGRDAALGRRYAATTRWAGALMLCTGLSACADMPERIGTTERIGTIEVRYVLARQADDLCRDMGGVGGFIFACTVFRASEERPAYTFAKNVMLPEGVECLITTAAIREILEHELEHCATGDWHGGTQ